MNKTLKFLLLLQLILTSIKSQPLNITSEESSSGSIVEVVQKPKITNICSSDPKIIRECVPYYLCVDGKINRNGSSVINPRSSGGQTCLNFFEECCIIEPPKILSKPKDDFLDEGKKIEEFQCGKRNLKKFMPKITKNSDGEAEFGEFPWMIAILKGKNFKI
jgi:hypothetical protein